MTNDEVKAKLLTYPKWTQANINRLTDKQLTAMGKIIEVGERNETQSTSSTSSAR